MVKKTRRIKEVIALFLALLAIAFLIINSIYFLLQKNEIINKITQSAQVDSSLIPLIPKIISVLFVFWIILAFAMSYIIYLLENKKAKWWYLLIASFFALITVRIDTFILGIVSSILYYAKKQKTT